MFARACRVLTLSDKLTAALDEPRTIEDAWSDYCFADQEVGIKMVEMQCVKSIRPLTKVRSMSRGLCVVFATSLCCHRVKLKACVVEACHYSVSVPMLSLKPHNVISCSVHKSVCVRQSCKWRFVLCESI